MAFKKTLAQRFFRMMKTDTRISSASSCSSPTRITKFQAPASGCSSAMKEKGDDGIFRRVFHKRASTYQLPTMGRGLNLLDDLRVMNIGKDRIDYDGLSEELTVEDARKLMKVAQMEVVKSKLDGMGNCISYTDFFRVCQDFCCDSDQAKTIAKALDEAGSVLVLGKAVYLQPDKIVKAIGGLLPFPAKIPNHRLEKELQQLEKQKMAIDKDADALVRRELWGGLGFLVAQTASFMRLTFWELSWDVMEPICFYVTSLYFMAGYGFFLRTSTEPSFEGFYRSRFLTKQRKLMTRRRFDEERYNKLKKLLNVDSISSEVRRSSPTQTVF